jgi:hypothetical protein
LVSSAKKTLDREGIVPQRALLQGHDRLPASSSIGTFAKATTCLLMAMLSPLTPVSNRREECRDSEINADYRERLFRSTAHIARSVWQQPPCRE